MFTQAYGLLVMVLMSKIKFPPPLAPGKEGGGICQKGISSQINHFKNRPLTFLKTIFKTLGILIGPDVPV